jgi:ssDNA-binding Zn-finger/Zn-ribbon topoisomerase 1
MATGKLKKTLSEKCPDCRKNLQVRSLSHFEILDGEEVSIEEDIVVCPECGARRELKKQRNRRELNGYTIT